MKAVTQMKRNISDFFFSEIKQCLISLVKFPSLCDENPLHFKTDRSNGVDLKH